MGVEQARAQAEMLVEQAGRHLVSHGEDARLLIELARFIVKRDH
jgi:farnesyl diphosphate synthase